MGVEGGHQSTAAGIKVLTRISVSAAMISEHHSEGTEVRQCPRESP